MTRPVVVKQRKVAAPKIVYIGTRFGNIHTWPGSAGTDLTTVDNLANVGASGQVVGPIVYNPGDDYLYAFRGGDTSGSITVLRVHPTTGATTTITTFDFLSSGGPYTLGGAPSDYTTPATPTAPFTYDAFNFDGHNYTISHFPMFVRAAALIGGQIYLSCHDYMQPGHAEDPNPAVGRNVFNVVLLARFDPSSGTAELVHGPFQIGQNRTFMTAYANPSSRFDDPDTSPFYWWTNWGYSGDNNCPGFVAEVGGTIYWSTGAIIYSSASGDLGTWTQVYDGYDADKLVTNHKIYGLHYPGAFDGSGNYLFGATGEKNEVVNANHGIYSSTNGTDIQEQPYTIADTDGTDTDGTTDGFFLPLGGLGPQEASPTSAGGNLCAHGEQIPMGNGTINPLTRAVLQLSGGSVSVVYEDTSEESDVGRAWMGRVMPIYRADWSYSSFAALSGGNVPGTVRDWTTSAYIENGGWSSDTPLVAPFSSGGVAYVRSLFTYKGSVYALVTNGTGSPRVELWRRTGASAWSRVSANIGVAWTFLAHNSQELWIPTYSFVSRDLGGSL